MSASAQLNGSMGGRVGESVAGAPSGGAASVAQSVGWWGVETSLINQLAVGHALVSGMSCADRQQPPQLNALLLQAEGAPSYPS